jgi:hypothetical protein
LGLRREGSETRQSESNRGRQHLPARQQGQGECGDQNQSPGKLLDQDVSHAKQAQTGPHSDCGQQGSQRGFKKKRNKG